MSRSCSKINLAHMWIASCHGTDIFWSRLGCGSALDFMFSLYDSWMLCNELSSSDMWLLSRLQTYGHCKMLPKSCSFNSMVTMGSIGSWTYVCLIKLLRPTCICCFKACVVKKYRGHVDSIDVNTSCRDDCQWLLQLRQNQMLQYGIHSKNVSVCISSWQLSHG